MHSELPRKSNARCLVFIALVFLFFSNCGRSSSITDPKKEQVTIRRWRCLYQEGSVYCEMQARRNYPDIKYTLELNPVEEFYDEAGKNLDVCNCEKNKGKDVPDEDKAWHRIFEAQKDEGLLFIEFFVKAPPSVKDSIKTYTLYVKKQDSEEVISNIVRGDFPKQ